MPSFRSPHTLPTEIILKFAEFLDEASLLALRHTNQHFFYIILLTPDRLPEVDYLAELQKLLRRLTDEYDKDRQGFCITCQEHRPLTSFSLSEVMALDRSQQASCIQHNQFWSCPHMSYDYQYMLNQDYNVLDDICCTECRTVFSHSTSQGPRPAGAYLNSTLTVALLEHRGGPSMLRDTIQRHCTRAFVRRLLKNIPAPICDHHLLSDRKVLDTYDPTDIDFYNNNRRGSRPREEDRTPGRSDGFCSLCRAMGAQTKFRFEAITVDSAVDRGGATIIIEVILNRSLGDRLRYSRSQKSRDRMDEHCRCHGTTKRRLTRFRYGVGSFKAPFVLFDGSIIR